MLSELDGRPFRDGGEIVVASDSAANRDVCFVRRNDQQNVEILVRRDGPSGPLYTLREVREETLEWRYLGEGEDIVELSANISRGGAGNFSEVLDDSIADVVARHALAVMKEIELLGASK